MSQTTSRNTSPGSKRSHESESSVPPLVLGKAPRLAPAARLRRWGLALADAAGIAIGIGVAALFDKVNAENVVWIALAIPVWILVAKLYELYDRDHRRITHATSEEVPGIISTAAVTAVLIKLLSEAFDPGLLPTAALLIAGCTAVGSILVLRSVVRNQFLALAQSERTVIVGSSPKARLVARRLRQKAGRQIDLIGYITATRNGDKEKASLRENDLKWLGDASGLSEALEQSSISRVVIADDSLTAEDVGQIIDDCRRARASVTLVPSNQELLGPDTELSRIAEVPMLDFHFSVPPRSTLVIKRVIDLSCASVLLVLASPLLAMAALLIKLDSPGPVIFRQVRIGENGRKFNMVKLRTMVVDAEERLGELIDLDDLEEPVFKIADDPRVTKVGSLLRRTSLDEIPQFINVLRGEMSMVGPRPEEEAIVALYNGRQRERLTIKPGLTGPMQVAGRGDLGFEERLAMERDYLDNLSITKDISILIQTPRAVIKGDGAF
jgi:exopolysaccharide biosynthesis polyprenyl glycosylphosphotransferase